MIVVGVFALVIALVITVVTISIGLAVACKNGELAAMYVFCLEKCAVTGMSY